MPKIGSAFVLIYLVLFPLASISSVGMLKQERDNATAVVMTEEEEASLGDPFFNLVLKAPSNTKLSEIETLIQPDLEKRQTFVVHETITDPTPGQQRRAVLSFRGENKGEQLTANVMMSVFFDSETFHDASPIEAWGWDSRRGRYNFYKLDQTGTPQAGWSWKFRGSSEGADIMVPAQRAGTCMACHINGAAVMKELGEPWNNWHSPRSPASYLTDASGEGERWKVANDERVKNDHLKVAEEFEVTLLSAISEFNRHRIDRALARTPSGRIKKTQGMMTVIDARRLLRPLFVTTEVNLISSVQKSGLHPFPRCTMKGPDEAVVVPNSFFLNANLINGGTLAQYQGLGLSPALEFERIARIDAAEYRDLTERLQVGLGGRVPGDADFAWFVPEPSHIDNDLIDQLLRRGIVSREFVAAVISVDLETPLFSAERESLLDLIPNSFKFRPNSTHPALLTTLVIQELGKRRPAPTSASGRFLRMLKNPDPVKILREQVVKYHARLKRSLENPETRQATIEGLYRKALDLRTALVEHEVLRNLDETRGLGGADVPTDSRLLPLPTSRGSGC